MGRTGEGCRREPLAQPRPRPLAKGDSLHPHHAREPRQCNGRTGVRMLWLGLYEAGGHEGRVGSSRLGHTGEQKHPYGAGREWHPSFDGFLTFDASRWMKQDRMMGRSYLNPANVDVFDGNARFKIPGPTPAEAAHRWPTAPMRAAPVGPPTSLRAGVRATRQLPLSLCRHAGAPAAERARAGFPPRARRRASPPPSLLPVAQGVHGPRHPRGQGRRPGASRRGRRGAVVDGGAAYGLWAWWGGDLGLTFAVRV